VVASTERIGRTLVTQKRTPPVTQTQHQHMQKTHILQMSTQLHEEVVEAVEEEADILAAVAAATDILEIVKDIPAVVTQVIIEAVAAEE